MTVIGGGGNYRVPDPVGRTHKRAAFAWFGVAVLMLLLVLWLLPHYSVWQQGLAGEAELKRATMNRQIAVQEAEAKRDAAKQLAQAEIERAKGVAEANRIIGESLQHGGEQYLRYLWIQTLEHSQLSTVYVPTEANLPILEAGRLKVEPK